MSVWTEPSTAPRGRKAPWPYGPPGPPCEGLAGQSDAPPEWRGKRRRARPRRAWVDAKIEAAGGVLAGALRCLDEDADAVLELTRDDPAMGVSAFVGYAANVMRMRSSTRRTWVDARSEWGSAGLVDAATGQPGPTPLLREALACLSTSAGVAFGDVLFVCEAPALRRPRTPWDPWSAAGHASRLLSCFRDRHLDLVDRNGEREGGHGVALFVSFFGERVTVNVSTLRRLIRGRTLDLFRANAAHWRRGCAALERLKRAAEGEPRRGSGRALVVKDVPASTIVLPGGGSAHAARYLVLWPGTDAAVVVFAARRSPAAAGRSRR